jgi:hypothetical protein
MSKDFGGVAFGVDGGPDGFDFARFSDEERTADDAHEFAPHELLLLPRAVGFDSLVSGIAEQRKIESVLGLEQGLCLDRIGAHPEDGDFELIEFLFCVTKLGRLNGSTGGVGLGIEKEEDTFALEIFEGDKFVLVRFQAKGRGFVAGLEHGHSLRQVLKVVYDPTASAAFSQMPVIGAKVRNRVLEALASLVDCSRLQNIRKHAL